MANRKPLVVISGAQQEIPAADTIGPTDGGTGISSYVVGDFLYCGATNTLTKLPGNTTTTRKFLRQTGTGSASAAPVWDTVTQSDVGLSGTFDVNGSGPAAQATGVYVADLGTTQGTTLNPTVCAAIVGQYNTSRSVAFSCDGTYIYGFRTHTNAGTYTWVSRVKNADTLTTSRNINGVAFNGSADITVADSTKVPLAGAATITGNKTWTGALLCDSTSPYNSGSGTLKLQMHGDGASAQGFSMFGWANSATFNPRIEFAKCRSGVVGSHNDGAGNGLVLSGDTLALINFNGSDGTAFKTAAQISALIDGTASTTSMPGRLVFSTTSSGATSPSIRMLIDSAGTIRPGADNTQNFGAAGFRLKEIFCGNNVINTSDARVKTAVAAFTNNEIAAAKSLSREIGIYQFLASVAEKGDKARRHIGLTVQRAIAIMEEHGLNPFTYGFICYDKWEELPEIIETWGYRPQVMDDFGDLIFEERQAGSQKLQEYRAAGDLYSFRYDQLNLFIARGLEARLSALEDGL